MESYFLEECDFYHAYILIYLGKPGNINFVVIYAGKSKLSIDVT